MFIDSHTHFDTCIEDGFTEEDLIKGMAENNLSYAVQVATEIESFDWSKNFAKKYNNIYYALGIHPSSKIEQSKLDVFSKYMENLKDDEKERLFAIGEIGLDYYWKDNDKESQRIAFEFQLELARKYNLPVVIHSRDALDDTYSILKECKADRGIIHCFSGGKSDASRFLDLGFHISFAGNVTYKKAELLQESASYVPLDRIFLETDAPYLTPVPHRGEKNRPDYVVNTYKYVAELKGVNLDRLALSVLENFEDFISGSVY